MKSKNELNQAFINDHTPSKSKSQGQTYKSIAESLEKEKADHTLFKKNVTADFDLADSHVTIGRLLSQAVPERCIIIWATVALFLGTVFNLGVPTVVGVLLDVVANPDGENRSNFTQLAIKLASFFGVGDSNKEILGFTSVILVIVICSSSFFSFLRGYLFTLAGERVVQRIRNRLFSRFMKFEMSFFDVAKSGELISRLATDTDKLKDAITVNISMGLRFIGTAALGIVYLFYVSWVLTLVMLSVIPIVAIVARWIAGKMRKFSKQNQTALAKANEVADETIELISTVRSFAREQYQAELYALKIMDTYVLGARIALYNGLASSFFGLAPLAAMMLVLWYGATLVVDGKMSVGVLTSYVLYTITVAGAFAGLSGLFSSLMQAVGASARVFELLDREPRFNLTGGTTLSELAGHIEFKDVTFAYPSRPEVEVLRGLCLTLQPGKITAVVGESGGGKSTIVSLIERFYDIQPGNGQILVDGHDLRSLDPSWFRRNIGYISQEPVLFYASVLENLLYGAGERPMSEVERACRMANAWDFIQGFPDKFQTMVGERGTRLSGGQKQRIAIARAILMNPSILIADEATSSLDAESEFQVQQALDNLMQGRTVLVVAHRLSTIKGADKVVVLDKGRVVEQGTHEELLKLSGRYARLLHRQLSETGAHALNNFGSTVSAT